MYLTKSFHRKRAEDLLRSEAIEQSESPAPLPMLLTDVPEEIMDFATVKGVTKDGLILEVDDAHIVKSSAVN